MTKVVNVTTILVNILAIGGIAAGGYMWINHRIDTVIEKRLQPYTRLIEGQNADDHFRYDDAIVALDDAFTTFSHHLNDNSARDTMSAVYDAYLHALASCDDPNNYSSNFNRAVKLFDDNALSPKAHHILFMGWYRFRTGQLDAARTDFNRARQLYAPQDMGLGIAEAYKGICCVYLADGNVNGAIDAFKEASERDTTGEMVFDYDPASPENRRISNLYRPFATAFNAFNSRRPQKSPNQK